MILSIRILSHPIKDYYVFKYIIEDMIRREEIEIKLKELYPKGPLHHQIQLQ